MKPGDLCWFVGTTAVEHVHCNQHRDGTVTDIRTGRVLSPREVAYVIEDAGR